MQHGRTWLVIMVTKVTHRPTCQDGGTNSRRKGITWIWQPVISKSHHVFYIFGNLQIYNTSRFGLFLFYFSFLVKQNKNFQNIKKNNNFCCWYHFKLCWLPKTYSIVHLIFPHSILFPADFHIMWSSKYVIQEKQKHT